MFSRRGLGFLRPASRPDRIWRTCHGYLRRSYHGGRRPARATPTRWKTSPATSPTRRPRRSSASTPAFLDLIPQTSSDRAARRRRDHAIALHQLGAGRRADGLGRDLHGDQRQRLLRGAKARQLHRRHAGVRRRRPLHPPRRLPDRQERLSRQRRRLLSAGRADRSDHRQPCPAVRRRCSNSRTTSCRRRKPPASTIAPTSPAIR